MVSSKINGFQISESRQKWRATEGIKFDHVDAVNVRFWNRSGRNGCGVAGFWKRTLTALPYRFYFEAICLSGFLRASRKAGQSKRPIFYVQFTILRISDRFQRPMICPSHFNSLVRCFANWFSFHAFTFWYFMLNQHDNDGSIPPTPAASNRTW